MAVADAFNKRLKRQVSGRVRDYFAVTAPGLENLCQDELAAMGLPAPSLAPDVGGVGFKGRLQDCYLANLHLRTASRILMRVASFKATNFRQLQRRLAALPWELYLTSVAGCQLQVTARHSRLYHTAAVAEQLETAIAERLKAHGPEPDRSDTPFGDQRVLVRVTADTFSISLDSSGDLLHKRGLRKHVGRAPIRETTAAAILKLAAYDHEEPLLDPMCGSGTFALEAAMAAQAVPAGGFRRFAFEHWPAHRPALWRHLRQQALERICSADEPRIFASDLDGRNVARLGDLVRRHDFAAIITVTRQNFFDLDPKTLTERPGLVVLNPPYGHRLGTSRDSRRLFEEIDRKLRRNYRGWKLALVVPPQLTPRKLSMNLTTVRIHHGGLRLALLTGRIP